MHLFDEKLVAVAVCSHVSSNIDNWKLRPGPFSSRKMTSTKDFVSFVTAIDLNLSSKKYPDCGFALSA